MSMVHESDTMPYDTDDHPSGAQAPIRTPLPIAFVISACVLTAVAPARGAPQEVQEEAATPAVQTEVAQGASAVDVEVDPMEQLFIDKCASCHSVGKGDRVGPDLIGVHERRDRDWLTRIIAAPSGMLASDPDARQLLLQYGNIKMPDLGLSDDQVVGLIDLIERCSATPCELAGKFVPVTEATEADIARGEALFLGFEPLVNGAVPCLACHTVQGAATVIPGGTLAMDLTHTYARLGDEGLDAALKSPAFLLMNKVYVDHPLDAEEAFALRAYLHEVNRAEPATTRSASLPLFGFITAGIALAILNAFWARRLRGVRQPLTRSSRRVVDLEGGGTLS